MKEKTPYLEALRYMNNAKDELKKAGHDGYNYADVKYVQMACGTAYLAVVIAITEYLKQKESSKFKDEPPKSIEEMRTRVAKINKKMLSYLNSAYDELHLHGYYMGTISTKIVKAGFEDAYIIIKQIEPVT